MKQDGELASDQQDALKLIEQSSHRIKHVLEALCETADLEEITKGKEEIFQVPGDKEWD